MRLAPVPLAFRQNVELAIHNAGESSRTTHAAPTTIDACRYFPGLLLGALEGRSKEELLSSFFYPGPDQQCWKRYPLSPEIAEIANGSFKQKQPPARKSRRVVRLFDRIEGLRESLQRRP
jgi:ADP-ribosyl-[dinitrogen reductase] hydrolase